MFGLRRRLQQLIKQHCWSDTDLDFQTSCSPLLCPARLRAPRGRWPRDSLENNRTRHSFCSKHLQTPNSEASSSCFSLFIFFTSFPGFPASDSLGVFFPELAFVFASQLQGGFGILDPGVIEKLEDGQERVNSNSNSINRNYFCWFLQAFISQLNLYR